MARSPYLALDQRIAAHEGLGLVYRWRYGRRLLEAKGDRKQLPHGMHAQLIAAARAAGLKLCDREIQRRVNFAEAYDTEGKARKAAAEFGSWTALVEAQFPAVESDPEPDELESAGISTAEPDAWGQLSPIQGLSPLLSVHGRKVPIDEATVADVKAYRDMYAQIHENYGKRLALIEAALEAMRDGSDGDLNANAVEAWKRGTGDEPERDETEAGAA